MSDLAVERMRQMDLRDRWGYPLEDHKLLSIAQWVLANPDADEDGLAIAMLTGDLPVVCEAVDTPAEDPLLRAIINEVLEPPGE